MSTCSTSLCETIPSGEPKHHYQMSNDTRNAISISQYLREHAGDPAVKDFLPRLKDHLLRRIKNLEYDGDETPFSEAEHASIKFVKHELYQHKVLRVNYTTYDLRCEQDSLNPCTHANIMLLSRDDSEEGHPYWYARIIGIFHARVIHESSLDPISMDFLWVRWYGIASGKSGWKARCLPRVGFIEDGVDSLSAFGFLDPMEVI
ncbi:hypothetical protein BDQ17DRAFT_1247288 [Cyathus striatus]|nr:hypothetical protein BDQ17DRAFT_1247288 [Cyathus striatus]